jgi:hypothetical protein
MVYERKKGSEVYYVPAFFFYLNQSARLSALTICSLLLVGITCFSDLV